MQVSVRQNDALAVQMRRRGSVPQVHGGVRRHRRRPHRSHAM